MTTVLSTLLLLLTAQPAAAGGPPVRIWLGSGPAVAFGAEERVYVQTSTDGNLVVLHARADGRVEMLFPATPTSNPFVRAGTYEIRGPTGGAAFATAESEGRGTVVAALSRDPMWFDEFVQNGTWNVAVTGGATNAEAVLTDVVQRMLGDGSFNYDVATYDVTPTATTIAAAPVTSPLLLDARPWSVTQRPSAAMRSRLLNRRIHDMRTSEPAPQTVVVPVSPVVTAGLAPVTVAAPAPAPAVVAEPQRVFWTEIWPDRPRHGAAPPAPAAPAPAAIGWRHPQPVIR